jgi:hypothetical protein
LDNNNQTLGYATTYKSNGFTFVKGSGPMVPQFKPVQALDMFTRFVNNQPF